MKSGSTILLLITLLLTGGCVEEISDFALPESRSERTYKKIRPLFWEKLYPDGGKTLYCGKAFGARHGREINIEHIFPMSWVTNSLRCGDRDSCRRKSQRFNEIESDMHNLYPALAEINYTRGAMSYALIKGEKHHQAGCDFEIDKRAYKAEPAPGSRGDIARAMLYMAATYPELKLFRRQRELMLNWHHSDPPDNSERRRNNLIEQLQGRRNPYIDNRL